MRSGSRSAAVKAGIVLGGALLITAGSLLLQLAVQPRQPAASAGCSSMAAHAQPPAAARRPSSPPAVQLPPGTALDTQLLASPYNWLRDDSRSRPEVLGYLAAENDYAAAFFAQPAMDARVDELAAAMSAAMPVTEVSSPRVSHTSSGSFVSFRTRGPRDEYWSSWRRRLEPPAADGPATPPGNAGARSGGAAGLAHAVAAAMQAAAQAHDDGSAARSNGDSAALAAARPRPPPGSELVLDENRLSAGHKYWDVVGTSVSPDGRRVAYLADSVGDERFSLQVRDITAGSPLLPQPLPGCAGDVLWWTDDTLIVTVLDESVPDRSRVVVHALQLQPQPQPQHEAAQPQHVALRAVLYEPSADESGLELKLSQDRAFLLLSSSVDGASQVLALPTSTRLAFSRAVSNNNSDSGALPAAAPRSAWWTVVAANDDLDVLHCDALRSVSGGSSDSAQANNSSSSGGGGSAAFVALVDDDGAPDGQLVLLHAAAPGASAAEVASSGGGAPRLQELLVANPGRTRVSSSSGSEGSSSSSSSEGGSSSSSSSEGSSSSDRDSSIAGEAPVVPPALEIRSFKLHPRGSHMAVAVRRQALAAVDFYSLHHPSASGPPSQAAAAPPRTVVLRTRGGGASAADAQAADAAAVRAAAGAAAASAAANASAGGTARLEWVLVPDDPTLLLDVLGLMVGSGGDADTWLAVQVCGITQPTAVFYVHTTSHEVVQTYRERVVGYDPAAFEARLEWARSAGGTAVPVTVAFRRDTLAGNGSNPAILHAYGAYGSSQWASFNPADVALLQRGVVLAIAHVRGGGELGSAWHMAGKKLHKANTFADLAAAAAHLEARGYTQRARLGLWGRSAGGLTMAAAINADPGLCACAVLDVPFLDVLGDMVDASLPLTLKERREWGDPLASRAAAASIAGYSPLHNLRQSLASCYPALLLTASLHDTRVNFWEPAKYVATLRHMQAAGPSGNGSCALDGSAAAARRPRPLLLMTDLDAGHFAASAASTRLEERALKLAFLLAHLEQPC